MAEQAQQQTVKNAKRITAAQKLKQALPSPPAPRRRAYSIRGSHAAAIRLSQPEPFGS
jgi:hypothetical protein